MLTHTIASVLLELGYLATGLLLCYMGQRMIISGYSSHTKVEGQIGGGKWKLITSSPGIIYAVCGLGIIIFAISTQSSYKEKIEKPVASFNTASNTKSPNKPAAQTTVTTHSMLLSPPVQNHPPHEDPRQSDRL